MARYKKQYRPTKAELQARYLTTPLGKHFVRGFIPHSIKDTDKPSEICDIFGVSLATARTWVKILKGPQISRNGKIVSQWTPPDFGAVKPNRRGTR